MGCPFCEFDLLLESKMFENVKDHLPKTRYLQAFVKFAKIKKLAEKEYKDRLGNSGRIRDLIKDCLNDMEMAVELKYGKRIRNHAIHKMTAFNIKIGGDDEGYYLRAMRLDGKVVETNEQVLPYLEKTLQKIQTKLGITENKDKK